MKALMFLLIGLVSPIAHADDFLCHQTAWYSDNYLIIKTVSHTLETRTKPQTLTSQDFVLVDDEKATHFDGQLKTIFNHLTTDYEAELTTSDTQHTLAKLVIHQNHVCLRCNPGTYPTEYSAELTVGQGDKELFNCQLLGVL